MRPAILPGNTRTPWRMIFRWGFLGLIFAMLAAFALPGCSPRAFNSVNKQAPEAPYWGERHSGMDRAEYLRVTEPIE
ncbi:MAG: hypothetical protein ACR2RF_32100 [Geminicoccaceae bacterium]